MKAISLEEFIRRAKNTHGDRFDYSETEYKSSRIKVKIICQEHGPFYQKPYDHFVYAGCNLCEPTGRGKITYEMFMKKIDDGYEGIDYSELNYISYNHKVEFVCIIHGSYWQTPKGHVHNGPSCPKCRREKQIHTRTGGYDKDEYTKYYDNVRRETYKSYKEYCHLINPKNLERGRGKGKYNIDHIFSTSEGFKNNIPPNIIGHWTNLKMLESSKNSRKNYQCEKTIERLLEDYYKEHEQ